MQRTAQENYKKYRHDKLIKNKKFNKVSKSSFCEQRKLGKNEKSNKFYFTRLNKFDIEFLNLEVEEENLDNLIDNFDANIHVSSTCCSKVTLPKSPGSLNEKRRHNSISICKSFGGKMIWPENLELNDNFDQFFQKFDYRNNKRFLNHSNDKFLSFLNSTKRLKNYRKRRKNLRKKRTTNCRLAVDELTNFFNSTSLENESCQSKPKQILDINSNFEINFPKIAGFKNELLTKNFKDMNLDD